MKFMLFMIPGIYQRADVQANCTPSAEMVEKMTAFNESMAHAGILLGLDGLHAPSSAIRVAFAGGTGKQQPVLPAAAGHVVGGYWLINVASQDEAIAWASRVPAEDGDAIEVRRVFEMDDFPADVQAAAASDVLRSAVAP